MIAPPRMARFRELLDLGPTTRSTADFTGWSKLVLLTGDRAVLFPRDHTQVEALRREITALRGRAAARPSRRPRVHAVWEDPSLSAYPVVVLDRLPGIPLASLVEDAALGELGRPLRRARPQAAAGTTSTRRLVPTLPRRAASTAHRRSSTELELDAHEAGHDRSPSNARGSLEPVLVHGDLHEGQLLVDARTLRTRSPGILDWQTARVDHPSWSSTSASGAPRSGAATAPTSPTCGGGVGRLRGERGPPDDLGPVFEWHHACVHARNSRPRPSPWRTAPSVVGTLAEARPRCGRAPRSSARPEYLRCNMLEDRF